jgi:glucose uptake protein
VYQPQTYAIALLFMVTSMCCWGSWANTVKLAPGYRFQLFYWDYVIGLFLGALAWGVSLGSFGSSGLSFLADLHHADSSHILLAMLGGVIFNIANLLLVAAIDIAGLAVAFPVGIGIALIVGAVSSYWIAPNGNALLLFGGIALVLAAIVCDAIAYREREREKSSMSRRGVVISVISGLLMGSFYPFVVKAMSGNGAPGPYAVSIFFVVGVALCALPVNYLFMRRPLDGKEPVAIDGYFEAPFRWHLGGMAGGAIWCTGAVLNFAASQAHIVGPAVSYSIGQGATMISAAWGVFVWREFASASKRSRAFLVWMFILFLLGLIAVALAPIV